MAWPSLEGEEEGVEHFPLVVEEAEVDRRSLISSLTCLSRQWGFEEKRKKCGERYLNRCWKEC